MVIYLGRDGTSPQRAHLCWCCSAAPDSWWDLFSQSSSARPVPPGDTSPCQCCEEEEEEEAARSRRAAVTCREAQGEGQEHRWILQGPGKGDVLVLKEKGAVWVNPDKILQPLALASPRAGLASWGQPWAWFGAMEPSKLFILNAQTLQACNYPVRLSQIILSVHEGPFLLLTPSPSTKWFCFHALSNL